MIIRRLNKQPIIYFALIFWSGYQAINSFYVNVPPLIPSVILGIALAFRSRNILMSYFLNNKINETNIYKFLLLIIVLFLLLTPFLQTLAFGNKTDPYNRTTLFYLAQVNLTALIALFLGAALQREEIKPSHFSTFLMILLSIIIFKNTDNGITINWIERSQEFGANQYISHMSMDIALGLLVSILYCSSKSYGTQISFILGLYILFAIGGRGSFYAFIFAGPIYLIAINEKKRALQLIILMTIALLIAFVKITPIIDDFFISRMLFSGGLGEDISTAARKELFNVGLSGLLYQSVIGNVNHIAETTGSFGGYIHNIMSAWQFYGAPFFFVVVYTIYKILKYIIFMSVSNADAITRLGVLVFIYSTFGLIFSKNIAYPFFWLSIGFWLARLSTKTLHARESLIYSQPVKY